MCVCFFNNKSVLASVILCSCGSHTTRTNVRAHALTHTHTHTHMHTGVNDGLVRFSCGLEDTVDLLTDVAQALKVCDQARGR